MRNRYPGACYRCGEWVAEGAGHFERIGHGWRVQHAGCAIEYRGQPDALRLAETARQHERTRLRMVERAKGTGRAAQRARKRLRDEGLLPPATSDADESSWEAGAKALATGMTPNPLSESPSK